VAPAPQASPSTHSAPIQPASSSAGEAQGAPATAPDASKPALPTATTIGFSLGFDPSTGRMFLEAQEPDSGFVIYRMPPKYVVKQFNASIGDIAPPRGTRIDSAA
jgi:hypothetical protein